MRQAVPLSLLAAVVSGLACLPMVNALLASGHTPQTSLGDLAGTVPAVAAGLLVHLACVRWPWPRRSSPRTRCCPAWWPAGSPRRRCSDPPTGW